MRSPSRTRNIAIIVTLTGAAMIGALAVGVVAPKSGGAALLAVVGFPAVLFGLCYVVYGQVELGRYRRFKSGRDAIARWTIEPEAWRAFVEFNDLQNARDAEYVFTLDAKHRARATPTEIVIGAEGLMIDDDFHSLPAAGMVQISGPFGVEGPPYCLDWRFFAMGGETTSSSTWALRVPVAPGHEGDARAVYEHCRVRGPAFTPVSRRGALLRRNIALAVAVLGAAGGVVSFLLRNEVTSNGAKDAVLIGMIAGVMLTLGGLIVAVAWRRPGKAP